MRLRMLVPAAALQEIGVQTRILTLDRALRLPDPAAAFDCQLVVFDQLYPFGSEQLDQVGVPVLELVGRLQRSGIKTVADIHDDHFDLPGRVGYFNRLVQTVDSVVVNTRAMQEIAARRSQRPIQVIGDPYEGPHGEVAFAPAGERGPGLLGRLLPFNTAPRLELAWIGHPSNLAALYDVMPLLARARTPMPIRIRVVTGPDAGVEEWSAMFNRDQHRRCRMEFVPWSPESTWAVLRECDLAVIPVDIAKRSKAAKSANRLIETLRAGRFAVASPLPAYQEFAECAWLTENIADGVEWAVQHPAAVVERICNGQRAVEQNYSPMAIAGQWQQMMLKLAG